MSYRVRLRVLLAKPFTSEEISRSFEFGGRQLTLQAEERNAPLSSTTSISLQSGGFETEDQAEAFGRQLVEAAEFAGLCSRLGVDVGIDQPTGWVNEAFAREQGLIAPDERIAPNIHGLMVYPDDGKTRIPVIKAEAKVTADPAQFEQALAALSVQLPLGLSAAANGARMLNLALINPQPLGQLVLSLSAVEELGQNEKWSDGQRGIIEGFAESAKQTGSLPKDERDEVADALLRGVHRVSLRQGVMRILDRLDLKHLRKEWDRIYGLRSGMFHGTSVLSDSEIATLAMEAITLCGTIVLILAESEGVQLPPIAETHFPQVKGAPPALR
jgi:hypothetical protein